MKHKWTGKGQGINSGLCDCGFHGEIIFSECLCSEYHSWCRLCWAKYGNDDENIIADVLETMEAFHTDCEALDRCNCLVEMNFLTVRWNYLIGEEQLDA